MLSIYLRSTQVTVLWGCCVDLMLPNVLIIKISQDTHKQVHKFAIKDLFVAAGR